MIPVLYESTETSFTSNGLGKLPDFITGTVTEVRNGEYYLQGTYPITGKLADELTEGRIILATHADGTDAQPFRIASVKRATGGRMEIEANHISYDLANMVVMPFTATSLDDALVKLKANIVGTCPFTFWTDKSVTGSYTLAEPRAVREILGGTEGSLLDRYGTGEYEFDLYQVKLHLHRGTDSGVTIRAGKNLTGAEAEVSNEGVYTAIVPYWAKDGVIVTLPEKVVTSSHAGAIQQTKPVDFSSRWENQPTEAQLREAAQNYLTSNAGWELRENTKVSFVPLWQTEEYKDYLANIERVHLCDTVTVLHEGIGLSCTAKVIQTDYSFTKDRYTSIEIGNVKRANLSDAMTEKVEQVVQEQFGDAVSESVLNAAIQHVTDTITGVTGGVIRFNYNGDGEPYELLVLDTGDIATAQNVWRWNKNGLGHSSTGYNGTYTLGMTADGQIVADMITTGVLRGLEINNGSGTFRVASDGAVTATSGLIANWTIGTGALSRISSDGLHRAMIQAATSAPEDGWLAFAVQERTSTSAAWTSPFRVNYDGSVVMTKADITTGNATIKNGTISGATITNPSMSGGSVSGTSISDGSATALSINNGLFAVTADGAMTATSGKIANWSISSNQLRRESTDGSRFAMIQAPVSDPATTNNIAFAVGAKSGSTVTYPFAVYYDGSFTSTKGTIANWSIGTGALSRTSSDGLHRAMIQAATSAPQDGYLAFAVQERASTSAAWTDMFRVNYNGHLIAKNADIEGTITSANATITGGSIKIESSAQTTDIIDLGWSYGSVDAHCVMSPARFRSEQRGSGAYGFLRYDRVEIGINDNKKAVVRVDDDEDGVIDIYDSSGTLRAQMYPGVVRLYNSSGKDLARLGVGTDYGWLYLYDSDGKRRVTLGDTGLRFYNSSGTLTKTYSAT